VNRDDLAEHIFSGVACLRMLQWSCQAAASAPSWHEALRGMEGAMREVVQMHDRGSGRVQGIYVRSDDVDRVGRLRLLVTKWLEEGECSPEIETLARECLDRLLGSEAASRLGFPSPSNVRYADPPAEPLTHAVVVSNLTILLGASFSRRHGSPGGWVILTRPPVWCEPEPVVPDLAGWRNDRCHVSTAAAVLPVPDWVCEVLSPLTQLTDRGDKVVDYIAHRVRYGWWIDPAAKRLEVFHLEGDRWSILSVFKGDTKVRAAPFDAIELDLSLVWTP
jgi:Uma2 family endonuclease